MGLLESELLCLELPCDENAPGEVRQALADAGDDWRLGDGMLIASELVTNAVTHSGCDDGHQIEVRATRTHDRLTISVKDPGKSGHSARLPAAGSESGGWGLYVVDQLARRWGSERTDGYRVWAELELAAQP
jgi:anti-sigma regulatory factor (Ser/Thr protein kinase)